IVECAEIECLTLMLLQLAPRALDFTLPDLVGQRLTGPNDVAVDLVESFAFREADVVEKERDCLLSCPVQRVDSRINDQSTGTPRLIAEHAEASQLVGVEAELIRKSFRVQRPAFDKGVGEPA